jgi:hypothetical protein
MKPIDIIVIILTVSVCLILVSSVMRPLITGASLSSDKAEMVAALVYACIAIISMYVGSKLNGVSK